MPRRCPVYLLLDTSGSMSGEPIQAVRDGVNMIVETLLSEPTALDTAWLSVITFSETAEEKVPLTPITAFNPPYIEADGLTAMGGALNLLIDCVERDVQRRKNEHERGDWRPIVFLLTDGEPTDDRTDDNGENPFDRALSRLGEAQFATFVALGAGEDANIEKLNLIISRVDAEEVKCLESKNAKAEDIKESFKLLSDIVVAYVKLAK